MPKFSDIAKEHAYGRTEVRGFPGLYVCSGDVDQLRKLEELGGDPAREEQYHDLLWSVFLCDAEGKQFEDMQTAVHRGAVKQPSVLYPAIAGAIKRELREAGN